MIVLSKHQVTRRTHAPKNPRVSLASRSQRARILSCAVLLASIVVLFACGGTSSSTSQNNTPLSGNWQFTTFNTDSTFLGGLQGGFLLRKNNAITGQMGYTIFLPPSVGSANPTLCNAGSASITGTVSGQSVNLTAIAGTQTFTFTGTLSPDGSTISGTYGSTAGSSVPDPNNPKNMVPCGTIQTGQQWVATSVPALNGSVQGSFHSAGSGANFGLKDQEFQVTGSLTQGPNIGATSATVTGTLNFQNYPCLTDTASVTGEISGNSVVLQIISQNGLDVGQIGAQPGIKVPSPVTATSSASGQMVLHGTNGYGLSTTTCKGGGATPGDVGNICLALGNSTACTQPITMSPSFLAFPVERLGTPPTAQTITVTNTDPSGTTLNGLQLVFRATPTLDSGSPSDFDLLPDFSEQDNCATTPGSPFSLGPQQSCKISVSFAPQQSCPWLPFTNAGGAAPSQCPPFIGNTIPAAATQTAIVTVISPTSAGADPDASFAVPISGGGVSIVVPSTPEIDFGAEAVSEASLPQPLSFTNTGTGPVQILPGMASPPCGKPNQSVLLPRPLVPGGVPGLQVVTGSISLPGSTVAYTCDVDPNSKLPNFQITADTCSGTLLAPQQSCSLAVTFAPQPTPVTPPLDYFLELNTLQCAGATTTDCEIDAGRFPVELKASFPSPLRLSPGAGLEFGPVIQGTTSDFPLTLTLFNDPNDPNSQTINFTSKILKGDYSETDTCGSSLAPGASCTFDISFTPKIQGFDPGSITLTFNNNQLQTIYMRGTGQ